MRIISGVLSCLLLLSACTAGGDSASNQSGFVTLLGSDTLAVEQFSISADRVEASVMLRTPSTSLHTYVMDLNEEGHMERLETTITTYSDDSQPATTSLIVASDSGFTITTTDNGEEQIREINAPAEALPFLDMIHWPFDLVLPRAYASNEEVFAQPLLSGRRAQTFEIRQLGPDSMTIKHPFRGTTGVNVNSTGHITFLDAGNTTRKLKVTRVASIDVESIAAYYGAQDKAGSPFGPLSGRGEALETIGSANIRIDYGTPSKRGRDIFGPIVKWGEVWRTGANRATHFETDQDLLIGDLNVPAGTYTLFTIPEPEGGTLMINTQTEQGGTTYNSDLDLGRVPMTRTMLDDVVEVFTISIEDRGSSQVLQISWDQSAFTVPVQLN